MSRHRRYVRAMLKAIDVAREPVWDFDVRASRTDGLRVIRRFERVNGTRFDPFNETHLEAVAGNGSHENFLRRFDLLTPTD